MKISSQEFKELIKNQQIEINAIKDNLDKLLEIQELMKKEIMEEYGTNSNKKTI